MLRMFRRIPFALSAAAVIVGTAFAYDPYLPNTILEIHGNNTTNLICDDINNTLSNNNGVLIVDSAEGKYASFGGNSNITVPYSAKFDWWKTDYTIETWVRAGSWATWSYNDTQLKPILINNGSQSSGANYWGFGPVSDGRVGFYYFNGAPNWIFTTTTLSTDTWHHIALTVSNNTIKIIINGVISATAAISGTPQSNGSFPVNIGKANNATIAGRVRDLRITNVNRYPANFDVADVNNEDYRSADYYWDSTIFLMDGNTVTDVRGNAITNFGVSSSSAEKLFTDNSIYFNGNSAFRINNPNPNFTFSSGDFTIEFNFKSLIEQIDKVLIGFRTPGNPSGLVISTGGYGGTSNGVLRVSNGGTNIAVSTSRIDTGAWARCAVVRKDGVIYVLVNGKLEGSGAFAGNIAPVANRPIFGANDFQDVPSSNFVTGYFDGIRVTKVARYTTDYSVMENEFPNYGTSGPGQDVYRNYVKLLMPLESAVDLIGGVVTASGTAAFTSTNARNGSNVVYFDGSSNCHLDLNSSNAILGSGDFTLEFQVYSLINHPAAAVLLDSRVSGNAANAVKIGNTGTGNNMTFADTGVRLNAPIALNKWVHVAFVRINGVLSMYVEGVHAGSTNNSTNYSMPIKRIGNSYDNNRSTCYMSDLRISNKGRYLGNFNPPTYKMPVIA